VGPEIKMAVEAKRSEFISSEPGNGYWLTVNGYRVMVIG